LWASRQFTERGSQASTQVRFWVLVFGCFHRLGLVEVAPDGFGGFAGDYGGEGVGGGLLDVAEAAEVGEETLAGLAANAGDVEEF
jgi:hypothetical protein